MGFQDEFVVELEDGEQYRLFFDLGAICRFEEQSGVAIAALDSENMKLATLVHLLAAGLRRYHPQIAKYDVLLNGVKGGRGRKGGPPLVSMSNLEQVAETLMASLMSVMPQEEDSPESEEESEGNDS